MTAKDVAAAARDRLSIDASAASTSNATTAPTSGGIVTKGVGTTANIPDLFASTSSGAAGGADEATVEVPLEVLSISKEDETLLRRCKWLLGRLTMGGREDDDADSTKTPVPQARNPLLSHLLAQTGDVGSGANIAMPTPSGQDSSERLTPPPPGELASYHGA
jgi:hypothetical protein